MKEAIESLGEKGAATHTHAEPLVPHRFQWLVFSFGTQHYSSSFSITLKIYNVSNIVVGEKITGCLPHTDSVWLMLGDNCL